MTKIYGIKAAHAVISDNYRIGKTDEGAIDEALSILRSEYDKLIEHWPVGKKANFHLVLTVDYPRDS